MVPRVVLTSTPFVALLATAGWVTLLVLAISADLEVVEASLGPDEDTSLYGLAYLVPVVPGFLAGLLVLACCLASLLARRRVSALRTSALLAALVCLGGVVLPVIAFVGGMESSWTSAAGAFTVAAVLVAMVPLPTALWSGTRMATS